LIVNLYSIIEKIALMFANDLNLIEAGNNGPYNHKETILRNKSNWIIIFSKLYRESKNKIYYDCVKELSEYLLSENARPNGFAFFHRDVLGKDSSNGLIGQAWTFEALYECYLTLGDIKFIKLAEKVFDQHKFDKKTGLWHVLDVNGKIMDVDAAFNHQLWFAYASAQIVPHTNKNYSNIYLFLDNINSNLKILENGLVYHPIERYAIPNFSSGNNFFRIIKRTIKNIIKKQSLKPLFETKNTTIEKWLNEQEEKSIGYHAFNMFAFVKLEELTKKHKFWKSIEYSKMIDAVIDIEFIKKNEKNKYSYPYNPFGFEFTFIIFKKFDFLSKIELVNHVLIKQFEMNFDINSLMFEKNNNDKHTLTSRLYELLSVPKNKLETISLNIWQVEK